jgi:hypothetical protein
MPYYMEAEVNSPMVLLQPGETYALDTGWFPTRIAGRPDTVTDAGIIERGLTVSKTEDRVLLSGSFGVFFPGNLSAYLFDTRDVRIGIVALQPVSPLDIVELHRKIPASPSVSRISIRLIDERGTDRGSLGEAVLKVDRVP